jgi:zinc-ribbon domain
VKCPKCGHSNEDSKKFCTSCGTELAGKTEPVAPAEQPTEVMKPVEKPATERIPVVPATPATPVPPVIPAATPAFMAPGVAPVHPPRSRKFMVITIVVVVALILIVGGIMTWLLIEANRTVASVKNVALVLASEGQSQGDTVDLAKVPLDKSLKLQAAFVAKYKSGRARLKLYVVSADGTELVSDSWSDIRSSSSTQVKDLTFHLTRSTGRKMTGKADLQIEQNGRKVASSSGTLSFTPVKGVGKEAQLEDAKQAATNKIAAAQAAIDELNSLGLQSDDLAAELSDAQTNLEQATTAQQANAQGVVADRIVTEADSRKAEAAAGQQSEATCRDNQARILEALQTYSAVYGNYPDQMAELVRVGYLSAMPVCPSGGTYSYQADLFANPPTVTVYCTFHGSL